MVRAGGGVDWQPRLDAAARRARLRPPPRRCSTSTRSGTTPTCPTASKSRAMPTASAELRWPLVRTTARAPQHVIEPIAQVIYSELIGDERTSRTRTASCPSSTRPTSSRSTASPAIDRLETGLRANLGISYTRHDPAGWSLGRDPRPGDPRRARGRVLRGHRPRRPLVRLRRRGLARLRQRADAGQPRALRHRARLPAQRVRPRLRRRARRRCSAAYIYLAEDDSNPILGPQPETNEFALDARYRVQPNWELRGLWRYDVASDSNLRAGAGITYGNECAEFDLSVSRRYTSSDNLPPSTSIGFNLRLAGIGDDGENETGRRGSARRAGPERRREERRCVTWLKSLAVCLAARRPGAGREPVRAGADRQRRRDHPLRHRAARQAARRARRQRRPAASSRSSS